MTMISIDDALADAKLMGAALGPADSWQPWLTTLRAAFALSLGSTQRKLFAAVARDRNPPDLAGKWSFIKG